MPLQLTGTWEQALIAAVARAVDANAKTGYLGGEALQKILYFLQQADVPMRYSFDIYYHGIYCTDIFQDVELMIADDVLRNAASRGDKFRDYRPAAGIDELLQAHADELKPYEETINTVVGALFPLQRDHLELIWAINFNYQWERAGDYTGPWKERIIELAMKSTTNKFPRTEVSAAYDSLLRAKLIEP